MSNKTELQANNIELQEILDSVNALPDATTELWTLTLEDGTVVQKEVYVK